jgi:K(+)-stimulated pyrophosphate-energized sodium pump
VSSSQEQLKNIAEILKAYPNVNVKLGGYTDNTGNAASNQKLSEDRATSVREELVNLGIDKDRLEAEGYGQEHPVASNDTEEGRAQNRRISIRVTKK